MKISKYVQVIGLTLSVVLFIVSYFYNFYGDTTTIGPFTRAALTFIIAILLSDGITRIIQKEEDITFKEDLEKILKSDTNTRNLGTPEDGIKYIMSAISKAVSVENTHVKFGNFTQDGVYNSKLYNSYVKILKEQISRGLIWRDLLGQNSFYRKEQLLEWVKENTTDRRVFTKIIDDSIPIVNHIIITYPENKKEVLFGWAYLTDRPFENVFVSSDPSLVEFFTKYFEALFSAAQEVNLSNINLKIKKDIHSIN